MNQFHQHQYENGLWLVAEPITGVQSLAMSLLVPAGIVAEPADQQGAATLVAEMMCRGAGELDARGHCDALDYLGVHRGTGAQTTHLSLSATMIGSKLEDALGLLLDMALRPTLPSNALEPSRDLALQALDALEDEPQHKAFDLLRQQHFPEPFGRSPMGRREHLEAITLERIKEYWTNTFVADGSILGFAGNFDWEQLKEQVDRLASSWRGSREEPTTGAAAPRGYRHQQADTAQVHIALAYDALPELDERSLLQRAAAAVLSGGMSSRLFTQVRERHGLCYAVYATYAANKHLGAMLSYAGTTTSRAQKTCDILRAELKRLSEGIEQDEFDRAITGMKSRLVMQGESTSARAGAIAADQYIYGRPRTLDELAAKVDAITFDELNQFVKEHPPGPMTVVTIGPEPLEVGP